MARAQTQSTQQTQSTRARDTPAVEPPRALDAEVRYPEGFNTTAEVTLELVVREDGSVAKAKVVEGSEPFASVALRAAEHWRFVPARRGERPVAALVRHRVRFTPPRTPVESAPPVSPPPPPEQAPPKTRRPIQRRAAPPEQPGVVVTGSLRAPGAAVVTQEEARALPGAFGDPLRAMESLPGVTPTVSGIPYFFVRGAPPANVGFFVDGVDVPLLYHAYFGPSVLHPGMLESVALYSGAPPVRYGRSAGAIMTANTRELRHQWNGQASLRVIDAGGMVEAPFAGTEGSTLVGGRYSYAGPILSLLSDVELRYWDYQNLTSYRLGPRDKLTLLAFGAFDSVKANSNELATQLGGEVQFHRVDLRWDSRPSPRTATRLALTFGLDRSSEPGAATHADDRSVRVRSEVRHQATREVALEFGADARIDDYLLRVHPLRTDALDLKALFPARSESTMGGYVGMELRPTPAILLMPGIRADVFSSEGRARLGVDPRVLTSFRVSRNLWFDQTLGVAHQRPNFVPQVPAAQVAGLEGGLQTAYQFSSGARWRLPEDVTASATVFRSAYLDAVDPIGGTRDLELDRNNSRRRWDISSYGIELLVRRSLSRRLGGFVAYTLSRSEHASGRVESATGFDRRHVLQAAVSYDLGKQTRVGVRAVYYSGIPALAINRNPPRFVEAHRGPSFFRVDLRIEKRWRLGETSYWGLVGEVLNATAGTEVLRVECGEVCTSDRTGPVVLPSVGVEAGF